ncbi:MAG TPA: sulfocyanin-like copper-binding protein [Gemmatimonadales bacterium]|nr:sulfocyanin-like copper-binding protein [Gemmatimonadales bacterium]
MLIRPLLRLLPLSLLLPATAGAQGVPADTTDGLPAWVAPDTAARSVTLDLVAEEGRRLNGHREGDIQVVVPAGWTIRLQWRNADSVPHGFVVQVEREKIPERAGEPAFQYAYSRSPVAGLPPGRTDHTQFVADTPGWYWILCGVPGHAIAGEWIGLRVDPEARGVSVVER